MSKLKKLTITAMLVAIQIVLSRFLYIYTPGNLDRLSFGFVPAVLISYLLGPVYGGLSAVVADVLGMLLNSAGLAFNPIFTIIAGLKGVVFGLLLYKKELTLKRITLTFVLTTICFELGLTPIALMVYYGSAFKAVVIAKIPVQIFFCVVKIASIYLISKPLLKALDKYSEK